MEALNKERQFALIMGMSDTDGFIAKYNKVIARLIKLEKQYKKNNPDIKMSEMWVCSNNNGQVKFTVARQCDDPELKQRLLGIFSLLKK